MCAHDERLYLKGLRAFLFMSNSAFDNVKFRETQNGFGTIELFPNRPQVQHLTLEEVAAGNVGISRVQKFKPLRHSYPTIDT